MTVDPVTVVSRAANETNYPLDRHPRTDLLGATVELADCNDGGDPVATRARLALRLRKLRADPDHQRRGYALEELLRELFALEGLQPCKSFRVVGQQIDGAFVWRNRTFLLEAKWTEAPAAGGDFGAFTFKLKGKTVDTRGLFLSMNGFSREGLAALQQKDDLRFVCLDGNQLEAALLEDGSLKNLLANAWRHADETGEAYSPGGGASE
jgi:hypothetical protein